MTESPLKLPMNVENPLPFIQPFLVLAFSENQEMKRNKWYVEVGGQISRYLAIDGDVCAGVNPDSNMLTGGLIAMTALLRKLIDDLAKNGLHVERVGSYGGSGGPSHYLRQGMFFERIS